MQSKVLQNIPKIVFVFVCVSENLAEKNHTEKKDLSFISIYQTPCRRLGVGGSVAGGPQGWDTTPEDTLQAGGCRGVVNNIQVLVDMVLVLVDMVLLLVVLVLVDMVLVLVKMLLVKVEMVVSITQVVVNMEPCACGEAGLTRDSQRVVNIVSNILADRDSIVATNKVLRPFPLIQSLLPFLL